MERFVLRPLAEDDYERGYSSLLAQLTVVGDISRELFLQTMQCHKRLGDDHLVLVIEDRQTGVIVASGTMFIEHKFIRNCGKVGHVEDVVVDQSVRGHGLGKRIIDGLTRAVENAGCYKAILDCSDENVPFYEKCGYLKKEIHMAKYVE